MKTKSVIVAAIAASIVLAGTSLAQRGGGGQGAGRPANQPAPSPTERPADRDDTPRQPSAQRPEQAQQEVQERAQVHQQTALSLAERLQPQADFHRELGLTPEQNATVARIRDQQRSEIREINQRWLLTRSQKDKRIREAQLKHDREIRALLTPDQLLRMEELEMRDRDRDFDGTRDQLKDRDRVRDPDAARDRDRVRDPQTQDPPPKT